MIGIWGPGVLIIMCSIKALIQGVNTHTWFSASHQRALGADSILDWDTAASRSWTPTNMANELEEINGIKPKVWLQDGEEREVSSQTRYFFFFNAIDPTRRLWLIFISFFSYHSSSVYKVKRTFDHYYWWVVKKTCIFRINYLPNEPS